MFTNRNYIINQEDDLNFYKKILDNKYNQLKKVNKYKNPWLARRLIPEMKRYYGAYSDLHTVRDYPKARLIFYAGKCESLMDVLLLMVDKDGWVDYGLVGKPNEYI
jgi:hypothetical protein